MYGIDTDKVDTLIQKSENILSSVNANKDDMKTYMRELSDSFEGRSLNTIFSFFCDQETTFSNISSVLDSYILLLKNVKRSYILQEENFSRQIKNKDIG